MKIYWNGREQTEVPILGPLTGVACDELRLDAHDAYRIAELVLTERGAAAFESWWVNLQCRFVTPPHG